MRLSVRIFIGYFALVAAALWWYVQSTVDELKPAYLQPSEEVMVDTANLLAELAAPMLMSRLPDNLQNTELADSINRYQQRELDAQIWSYRKTSPDLIVYITDARGQVLFHTDASQVGADYSQWLDVSLTLKGEYGARTSEAVPGQVATREAYVAAPIMAGGEIIGVLSVGKPHSSLQPLLNVTQRKVVIQGILLMLAALVLGVLLSWWLTTSIRRLTEYARRVRDGERIDPPRLKEKELSYLAQAMDEMRVELRAANYVERYIHSITHEMKSPIAAIRGAAELLSEPQMPEDQRARFIGNINTEIRQLQNLTDRLLELAKLEKQERLLAPETLDPGELLQRLQQRHAASPAGQQRRWDIRIADQLCQLSGDEFLLEIALNNVLDNAVQFCPPQGLIRVSLTVNAGSLSIRIANQGEPIPDYALGRVFERFYSLPRPSGQRKSTGLGLAIVREIITLHDGSVMVRNAGHQQQADDPSKGVEVEIILPVLGAGDDIG